MDGEIDAPENPRITRQMNDGGELMAIIGESRPGGANVVGTKHPRKAQNFAREKNRRVRAARGGFPEAERCRLLDRTEAHESVE